jgi:hypothetical protein
MASKNIEKCPTCGQSVNTRQISLFKELIIGLLRVWAWCNQNDRHEFTRKEVKHLFKSENISARFGDLVYFGGLVYKQGKGNYGLNMERMSQFVAGRYAIPTVVCKNPLTKEITHGEKKTINDIPSLKKFLDENGEYISKYI